MLVLMLRASLILAVAYGWFLLVVP